MGVKGWFLVAWPWHAAIPATLGGGGVDASARPIACHPVPFGGAQWTDSPRVTFAAHGANVTVGRTVGQDSSARMTPPFFVTITARSYCATMLPSVLRASHSFAM